MNTVLFDLDGTLLPMNTDEFTETYMKSLAAKMQELGYDAKRVIDGLWLGVKAMTENDGYITNEECFWKVFEAYMCPEEKKMQPRQRLKFERALTKFYNTDFAVARFNTRPTAIAKECIDVLKDKGYQIVIATNPIFPAVATLQRLSWAGIDEDDYILVTTYENSCFTKPNLSYYRRLLQTIDKDPEDCLMVGNDVHEDMCAFKLGMDVFLLDECLINKYEEGTMEYKRGGWKEFRQFVNELPSLC